jgi:hypothetical protein
MIVCTRLSGSSQHIIRHRFMHRCGEERSAFSRATQRNLAASARSAAAFEARTGLDIPEEIAQLANFYLEAREKLQEATEALEMGMTYESTPEELEALEPEKADEDELSRAEDFTEEMAEDAEDTAG